MNPYRDPVLDVDSQDAARWRGLGRVVWPTLAVLGVILAYASPNAYCALSSDVRLLLAVALLTVEILYRLLTPWMGRVHARRVSRAADAWIARFDAEERRRARTITPGR